MKKIIVALMIGSLLFISTGCGCSKKEEEKPIEENQPIGNTNEGVIQDQEVSDLKMTNTALSTKNGISQLTTTVTNETSKDIMVETFDIFIKDQDGNVMATLQGYVGGVVPAGQSREIVSSCTIDLSEAASVEYQLNEK